MAMDILSGVLKAHSGRFVGDGVAVTDLQEVTKVVQDWSQWYRAWTVLGDKYEDLAKESLAEGAHVSAGEFFWSASLAYQYAQFLWFHDPREREEGQRRKQELYLQAAPYLVPKAERFDLPLGGYTIPGYLRLPPGPGPFPCVILLGGLESTKEESYLFEQMCLRRGLATCTFDGPGQGEMFFQVELKPDFERYCSRVIDYLETQPDINVQRLGALGRSLGGYFAVRSAVFDPRLIACACWGAFFDLSWWENISPLTQDGFIYITKIRDKQAAVRYLTDTINLAGTAEKLNCSLYVLHGGQDTVIPGAQSERLEMATRHLKDRTFDIEPEGNHCCHNIYPIVRSHMADWLVSRLK